MSDSQPIQIASANFLADTLLGWQSKNGLWYGEGILNTGLKVATTLNDTLGFFRPDLYPFHSQYCTLVFCDRFFLKIKHEFKSTIMSVQFINTFIHYSPGTQRAIYKYDLENIRARFARGGINEVLTSIIAYLKINRINSKTPFYQNIKGQRVIEEDFTIRSYETYLKECEQFAPL